MPRLALILIAALILLPQIRTAQTMGQWTPLLIDLAMLVTAFLVLRFIARQIGKRVLRPITKGIKGAWMVLFVPRHRRFPFVEDDAEHAGSAKGSGSRDKDDTMEFAPLH